MEPQVAALVREYRGFLRDLKAPEKRNIVALTEIARDALQTAPRAARGLSEAMLQRALEAPPAHKLAALYLMDSSCKLVGDPLKAHLVPLLPEAFAATWQASGPDTWRALQKLAGTWRGIVPASTLDAIFSLVPEARAAPSSSAPPRPGGGVPPQTGSGASSLSSRGPRDPRTAVGGPMRPAVQQLPPGSQNSEASAGNSFGRPGPRLEGRFEPGPGPMRDPVPGSSRQHGPPWQGSYPKNAFPSYSGGGGHPERFGAPRGVPGPGPRHVPNPGHAPGPVPQHPRPTPRRQAPSVDDAAIPDLLSSLLAAGVLNGPPTHPTGASQLSASVNDARAAHAPPRQREAPEDDRSFTSVQRSLTGREAGGAGGPGDAAASSGRPGALEGSRLKEFSPAALARLAASSLETRDRFLDRAFLKRREESAATQLSRLWYLDREAWLRAFCKGWAEQKRPDGAAAGGAAARAASRAARGRAAAPLPSVTADDAQTHCSVSGEPLEALWDEQAQEWRVQGAKRLGAREAEAHGVPAGSIALVSALGEDDLSLAGGEEADEERGGGDGVEAGDVGEPDAKRLKPDG